MTSCVSLSMCASCGQGREAVRHAYFSTSPLPKEPDLMPTFPTRHDLMVTDSSDSHGWVGQNVSECLGQERSGNRRRNSSSATATDRRNSRHIDASKYKIDRKSSTSIGSRAVGASGSSSRAVPPAAASLGKRMFSDHE